MTDAPNPLPLLVSYPRSTCTLPCGIRHGRCPVHTPAPLSPLPNQGGNDV